MPYVDDHLYVMQNEFGLIKVGRSVDVERRRKEHAREYGCSLAVIHLAVGKGPREEDLLLKLRSHHLDGEWYPWTIEVTSAIERFLNMPHQLTWAHKYEPTAAQPWLEKFELVMIERYLNKTARSLVYRIKDVGPGDFADGDIWVVYCITEWGVVPYGEVLSTGTLVQHPEQDEVIPLPKFSSQLDLAMSLWPDDARPVSWTGTTLECCLEALRERIRRMPTPTWAKIATGD